MTEAHQKEGFCLYLELPYFLPLYRKGVHWNLDGPRVGTPEWPINKIQLYLQVYNEQVPVTMDLSMKNFLLDDATLRDWNYMGLPGKIFLRIFSVIALNHKASGTSELDRFAMNIF